ncbi:DUF6466 family protein [Bifidobacterium sp. ESL0763]|uniref:DUF6466 family protein n=1 Tax=Bifidobacterium sp. ESL0763 TaxID=2983227 RepID=UPI0023F9813A|nr:DUF6466 family protein [Bifidobacterium sp. ESL0763]MDF7663658.1 DUF6466 family protein [Bifidobacterium sp. ESL0763]
MTIFDHHRNGRQAAAEGPKAKATPSAPPAAGARQGRPGERRKAMAPLAVRITLGVFAAAFLAGAGLVCANISAISTYNQATTSLNQTIATYNNPESDLQSLKTRQDQIDQQFESADTFAPLLLPQVRSSIKANRTVLHSMSKKTSKKLAVQQGKGGQAGAGRPGQSSNEAPGLSDEQRKQIEQTLKANQPASGAQKDGKTTTDEGNKAKPW